ncbi:IS30 family transposase, partial [Pediococcus ethanolidurans]
SSDLLFRSALPIYVNHLYAADHWCSHLNHVDWVLRQRQSKYFNQEFGHLEGDTVQGKNHQGAVTTLVERQTKVAIVVNSHTKSAHDVNRSLAGWLSKLPRHLSFDNGKEFAGWRTIANQFDLN